MKWFMSCVCLLNINQLLTLICSSNIKCSSSVQVVAIIAVCVFSSHVIWGLVSVAIHFFVFVNGSFLNQGLVVSEVTGLVVIFDGISILIGVLSLVFVLSESADWLVCLVVLIVHGFNLVVDKFLGGLSQESVLVVSDVVLEALSSLDQVVREQTSALTLDSSSERIDVVVRVRLVLHPVNSEALVLLAKVQA